MGFGIMGNFRQLEVPESVDNVVTSKIPLTVGSTGLGALWIGFVSMLCFSLYFIRASFMSHSKSSRLYHFITSLIVFICSFAYLVMALGSQPYKPLGKFFDIIWVHYADWVIATPMLLIDLGMLAGMPVPEVFFICFMDILMIGSGYAAHVSTDYRAAWPLFAFGCLCEIFILGSLLMHLYAIQQEKAGSAEAKTFTFLALWTITLWSAYPVLFALSYTHVMDIDTEVVIYMILDLLAKGVFGAILVGSRECLEGDFTPMAMMAMAMVGIKPDIGRRNSVDLTLIEEARLAAHRGESGRTKSGKVKKRPNKPESDDEDTGADDDNMPLPDARSLKVREVSTTSSRGVINVGNPIPAANSEDQLTMALLAALQSPTVAAKIAAAISPTYKQSSSGNNSRPPSPTTGSRRGSGAGPASSTPLGNMLASIYGGGVAYNA